MSYFVRPKKHLGQHFLKDENIARKIVASLKPEGMPLLEIGPGTGVLSKHLLEIPDQECLFIDTDKESVDFLMHKFPEHADKFIHGNFLKADLDSFFPGQICIIGNLPYNISSQILFKILDNRDKIVLMVGMIQKEVAERLASGPGTKTYGILSVLLQAFYRIEYLFTVSESVFNPPPKVKSAVFRLTRNDTERLDCDENLFFKVVKTAFNQRRKTLRNSLKSFYIDYEREGLEYLSSKRAEELRVEDYVKLARVAI